MPVFFLQVYEGFLFLYVEKLPFLPIFCQTISTQNYGKINNQLNQH